MNIDPQEFSRLAAAQAPRFDMYAGIHKGLRACMADTLLAIGRMDADDALEVAQTTERLMQLLELCASHLDHENRFLHAAMDARAPGSSAAAAHDHEEHEREIAGLAAAVTALRQCGGAERAAQAHALYHQLARFVAANFQHMQVEETAHNAVLWAHYTDAELVQIHDALVASIPPQEMMQIARWLLPFLRPAERAAVLLDMRSKAPAPAFDALLAVAAPHLTAAESDKLARALATA